MLGEMLGCTEVWKELRYLHVNVTSVSAWRSEDSLGLCLLISV